MNLLDIAGWVALIAATMTAANLGARVTGWGFVVFAVGSLAWSFVALSTGQQNLLWTNGFLLVVNAVGIWRWLGRQTRYEDGSQNASSQSAKLPAPTLIPAGSLPGRRLVSGEGVEVGTVVEAMMRCDTGAVAYVVVAEGGVGGVGEKLHAIQAGNLRFTKDDVVTRLSAADVSNSPKLENGAWPAAVTGDEPVPARG